MIQCVECGEMGLKWNYEDFKKHNIWRLWQTNPTKPHKCSLTFFQNSVDLVERDLPCGKSEIQTTKQ